MPRPTDLPQPSDSFTSLDQATKSYTHTPVDPADQAITTIVGNPDLTDFFYPHVRFSRWGGEAWVELQLQYNAGAFEESVQDLGDGKLIFTHAGAQMRFYPLAEDDLPGPNDALGQGGYEIDAVLQSNPAQPRVSFNIVTHNCNLHYQPDAATQEAASGLPAGSIEVPPHVEGSYAVYSAGDRSNNRYRTGKVCHLFRPLAVDANGDSIYCDYNADAAQTGVLTVSVDRQWLRNATYPVVIDPTAGHSSQGGSNINIGGFIARLCNADGTYDDTTGTLSGDQSIDGCSAYCYQITGSSNTSMAVYEDTGTLANDNKIATSSDKNIATSMTQEDFTISGTMTSGGVYRCGIMSDHASGDAYARVAQDYIGGSDGDYLNDNGSYAWPATLTGYGTAPQRISAWLTYSAAAASVTGRITAIDADITYDLKTSRVTAVDADFTYDPKTGRVTAVDADFTYDQKTGRVTAVDADFTYNEKAGRVTAVDADVTYTFPATGTVTAMDADITYVSTYEPPVEVGRPGAQDTGDSIETAPGVGKPGKYDIGA